MKYKQTKQKINIDKISVERTLKLTLLSWEIWAKCVDILRSSQKN